MIKELICTYHLAAKPSITHVVHFTLYVLLYVVCIVILYLLYLQEEVKSVNLRLFLHVSFNCKPLPKIQFKSKESVKLADIWWIFTKGLFNCCRAICHQEYSSHMHKSFPTDLIPKRIKLLLWHAGSTLITIINPVVAAWTSCVRLHSESNSHSKYNWPNQQNAAIIFANVGLPSIWLMIFICLCSLQLAKNWQTGNGTVVRSRTNLRRPQEVLYPQSIHYNQPRWPYDDLNH